MSYNYSRIFLAIFLMAFLLVVGLMFMFPRVPEPKVEVFKSLDNSGMSLTITTASFEAGGSIPSQFTCDGEDRSPELSWSGVPEGTKTLALLMDDPDIPENVKERIGADSFDHWVLYNIDPATEGVAEGGSVGMEGLTSRTKPGYVGPCPPDREHRYFFRLYALDTELSFDVTPTKDQVLSAMEGHVLESAELMGLYNRVGN